MDGGWLQSAEVDFAHLTQPSPVRIWVLPKIYLSSSFGANIAPSAAKSVDGTGTQKTLGVKSTGMGEA